MPTYLQYLLHSSPWDASDGSFRRVSGMPTYLPTSFQPLDASDGIIRRVFGCPVCLPTYVLHSSTWMPQMVALDGCSGVQYAYIPTYSANSCIVFTFASVCKQKPSTEKLTITFQHYAHFLFLVTFLNLALLCV